MTDEIVPLLKRAGAFVEGHFELSSGLHSSNYVQCALVFQQPQLAQKLGQLVANLFKKERVQVVIAPAIGGIILSHEVARALGVRALFAERSSCGEMTMRRGFKIGKGERVLVVEDVITTGGSVRELIELVRGEGAKLAGCGCIVDRSGGNAHLDAAIQSLVRIEMEVYKPDECPLCKQRVLLKKPGSRK